MATFSPCEVPFGAGTTMHFMSEWGEPYLAQNKKFYQKRKCNRCNLTELRTVKVIS